ncbi:MAG TPA: TA system VapC family ribonuclease toxin [Terriglobia bacterium]|nr:TA system VapC family ribonuclease toxin [Terriglobia bacterium]
MPKLKITLPDINVWVALASDRHVHHAVATNWFAAIGEAGAAFCRITQMGCLRLLTNSRVMADDVLNQRQAWAVYEQLARDERVVFALEPPDIEPVWKKLTQSAFRATGRWTDAYIAALALLHNFQVVSFDKEFRKIARLDSAIL